VLRTVRDATAARLAEFCGYSSTALVVR